MPNKWLVHTAQARLDKSAKPRPKSVQLHLPRGLPAEGGSRMKEEQSETARGDNNGIGVTGHLREYTCVAPSRQEIALIMLVGGQPANRPEAVQIKYACTRTCSSWRSL